MLIKDWLESSKALCNMYSKIAEYDYQGKLDSEECKNIISLLDTAAEFETQKIEKIQFTDENIEIMLREILSYFSDDADEKDLLENLDHIEYITYARLFNYVRLQAREQFIPPEEFVSLHEFMEKFAKYHDYVNERYKEFYSKYTSINSAYILDIVKNYIDDDEIKLKLTKLMYFTILIHPNYEPVFRKTFRIKTPINMNTCVLELSDIDDINDAGEHIKAIIIATLNKYLHTILEFKDEDLVDKGKYFQYIKYMSEIITVSISLYDEDIISIFHTLFMIEIEREGISEGRERILDDFERAIQYSRKLINEFNQEKGLIRELKDEGNN